MKGWILLMEAVIGLAKRDLKSKSAARVADANWFLNSEWYEEMEDICRTWHADNDSTNKLA